MATTLPPQEELQTDPHRVEIPGVGTLEDRFPEWMKAPRIAAIFAGLMGFYYVILSYRPLWHTDLWGHLAFGRFIWSNGHIPATTPLMPLSQGVPFVDTAWLTQLLGYEAFNAYGTAALQFLYATAVIIPVAVLVFRTYGRTRNAGISLIASVGFIAASWSESMIIRPQLAGVAFFMVLFAILTAKGKSRMTWLAVPAMFLLWANMHGSFLMGLGLLGSFCLGRAIDVLMRTRDLKTVFFDSLVRRYFILFELSAIACLVNPYGLGLYIEVISFSQNPNLADLIEWQPLQISMPQGQAAFLGAMALMFAYRWSPRRVSATEVLLLAGLGLTALWSNRMLLWWMPPAAYYFALHAAAAWKSYVGHAPAPSPRSGKWSVMTIALLWICFAITPIFSRVAHGVDLNFKKIVSQGTPVEAVKYLNEHPPTGQVFNTYEWGDYLLWAGPKNIQVFTASHAHLVPKEVWTDYMQVATLQGNWEDRLDRYSVNTIIVDQQFRGALIAALKANAAWSLQYEDKTAAIFVRGNPI